MIECWWSVVVRVNYLSLLVLYYAKSDHKQTLFQLSASSQVPYFKRRIEKTARFYFNRVEYLSSISVIQIAIALSILVSILPLLYNLIKRAINTYNYIKI